MTKTVISLCMIIFTCISARALSEDMTKDRALQLVRPDVSLSFFVSYFFTLQFEILRMNRKRMKS